ncbi:very-long-chain (3R)-3-hydroxyacyl-CoA dehydratase 1 isoform X4 [Anolis carolinensis]|uniref:very-long-chain (3R)-3-hydroxyacyl-CoA dehydratase 1 isoform X4 n=1 Tax=Anolis carolinensis TaxID=28377 RepID=UPI002F2B66F2
MAPSEEDGNGSAEEKENSKKAVRRGGAITTAWLIFYNITMTAGWLVLAIAMARFYLEKGTYKGLYKSIQKTLKFFQTFALLEIIHCAVGVVHTSVLVTGVQVCSRIFMVWFITHSIKQIQNEDSVIIFLVVWTVTEITRYSFYTFNMLNHLPYFIKWARYNFFIILYPVGVVVFPQLYFHMLRQRRKVLHGEVIVEKDD